MALFFLPKKQLLPHFELPSLKKLLLRQASFSKWIRRAKFSPEVFILLHLIALLLTIILAVQTAFGATTTPVYTPIWALLLPNGIVYLRNKAFARQVSEDVEEILRLSYLLEKSGTESRRVNLYLAQAIKGPLQPHLQEIAAGHSLNVDLKVAYQKLKTEMMDIRPVVNYCNISMQKISTGKTGNLYKQQLDQIKQLKLNRFKMRRMNNRIKLCLFALLLFISFISLTVYPMAVDTYNTFMGSMSN